MITSLSQKPRPETALEWLFASRLPALYEVAQKTGLLSELAVKHSSADQLAEKLALSRRGVKCLLDCLLAARVLTRQGDDYVLALQELPAAFFTLKQSVQTLVQAIQDEIFERVAEDGSLPGDGVDPSSAQQLSILGIIKDDGGVACGLAPLVLTEAGRRYFTPGQDYYIGSYLHYMSQLLNKIMQHFFEVVKTGQPVMLAQKDPALFAPLVDALFPINYEPAQQFADYLLSSTRTLETVLDVGAGSAAWSIPLAQRNAQLHVDVLDFPPVLNITRAFTQRYGVQNQYRFLPGDLLAPDHWRPNFYDLIYLGHVACIFSEAENQELFRRCAECLKPGGSLVLIEFCPQLDRTGPLLDVLFSIIMISTNEHGDAYPREYYEAWSQMADLDGLEWLEVPTASTPFLIARKPVGKSSSGASPLNTEPYLSPRQAQTSSQPFVPPTQIIDTMFAFAQSTMLLAAVELQVFTHIAHGAHTPAQLASQARVSQPALERLLGGLLAMGFLQRVGQHYDLTPLSARYLVSDRPTYIGGVALQVRQEWKSWIRLTDAVRTGQSILHINEEPLGGKFFASLDEHIFPLVYPLMQQIFKRLELGTQIQGAQILDLGAGTAPGAIAALELDQQGHATLVDFALVLERAKNYVEEHGVDDRIAYWPTDLAVLDLPANQFDLAIASHLFRILGAALTQRLISQSYQALKANGRLIIVETYSEPERYWKLFPHIVSLNMLVNTRCGDTFTLKQMCQWLQDAGFQVDVWLNLGPDPIVVATHPEEDHPAKIASPNANWY